MLELQVKQLTAEKRDLVRSKGLTALSLYNKGLTALSLYNKGLTALSLYILL